jgi:thioredoxin reductase (NADPH)
MKIHDVIVIGSGPAGLTAAIYAARANLSPLVIEGFMAGGQLMTTTEIENFPGFPKGITGPDLMAEMRAQAERFGTEFISSDVTRVDFSSSIKMIWVEEKLYQSRTVILATGATANYLGLPSELRLQGRGVSACATCDGFFFKGKNVAVIGGGDSAMEEATFLTRFATKVYLVHRREGFRASKIMVDKASANEKVAFYLNRSVLEVLGDDYVTGLRLFNNAEKCEEVIDVDGVFLAIGHTPATALFKNQIQLDEKGYVVTGIEKGRVCATSIAGVFACGDVQDSHYRQAITSAGSGCMAAIEVEKYLEAQ